MMDKPRYSVGRNAGQVTVCAVLLDEIDEAIQVHLVTVDDTAKGQFVHFCISSCYGA